MDRHRTVQATTAAVSGESLGAGKIHVLGLAPLKDRLGSKWDRMSAHVHLFFDAAVKRHLRPGDSFLHAGELSYVLTFPGRSLVESQLVCAAIAEEVCSRLFGENGEHVILRNLVAEMDKSSITSGAVIADYLERHGVETIVSPAAPKPTAICPPKSGGDRHTGPPPSRYVFRPLWDVANHAVLTYICQPDLAGRKIGAAEVTASLRPEIITGDAHCRNDIAALRECSNRIGELQRAGLRVLLGVPVHFGTLCHGRSWGEYSSIYRQIPPDIATNLAFFVHGIEGGVPHIRLAQELPKLSRGGHRVFCSLSDLESSVAQFASTSVHAMGLSLDASPVIETRMVADLNLLVRSARTAGVHTFILGVSSTSLALYAIEAGVRYLEGAAIRPAVSDPRHAFAHDIADLYLARAGTLHR